MRMLMLLMKILINYIHDLKSVIIKSEFRTTWFFDYPSIFDIYFAY